MLEFNSDKDVFCLVVITYFNMLLNEDPCCIDVRVEYLCLGVCYWAWAGGAKCHQTWSPAVTIIISVHPHTVLCCTVLYCTVLYQHQELVACLA